MNVLLTSAFRDAPNAQIHRWINQVNELASIAAADRWDPSVVRAIAVEGDSMDRTAERIDEYAYDVGAPVAVVNKHLGTPRYGSTEDPARMRGLSYVLNHALKQVAQDVDVLIHVESDLIWEPETLFKLADTVHRNPDVDVVAPLVFAGELFYDVWAFRLNGSRFSPLAPYHAGLSADELTRVDSVGSCLAIKGSVAREIRVLDENALVGWCGAARERGYSIYVDPTLSVRHPL